MQIIIQVLFDMWNIDFFGRQFMPKWIKGHSQLFCFTGKQEVQSQLCHGKTFIYIQYESWHMCTKLVLTALPKPHSLLGFLKQNFPPWATQHVSDGALAPSVDNNVEKSSGPFQFFNQLPEQGKLRHIFRPIPKWFSREKHRFCSSYL